MSALPLSIFLEKPTLFSKEFYPFSLLQGMKGIPQGALVEIQGKAGSGKTEILLEFLKENPQTRVAWIQKEFSLYPPFLQSWGLSLSRFLFVRTSLNNDIFWIAHQTLQSRLFQVLVLEGGSFSEKELRRLQLGAENAKASVVFLVESKTGFQNGLSGHTPLNSSWIFALRLEIFREVKELDVFKKEVPKILPLKARGFLTSTPCQLQSL